MTSLYAIILIVICSILCFISFGKWIAHKTYETKSFKHVAIAIYSLATILGLLPYATANLSAIPEYYKNLGDIIIECHTNALYSDKGDLLLPTEKFHEKPEVGEIKTNDGDLLYIAIRPNELEDLRVKNASAINFYLFKDGKDYKVHRLFVSNDKQYRNNITLKSYFIHYIGHIPVTALSLNLIHKINDEYHFENYHVVSTNQTDITLTAPPAAVKKQNSQPTNANKANKQEKSNKAPAEPSYTKKITYVFENFVSDWETANRYSCMEREYTIKFYDGYVIMNNTKCSLKRETKDFWIYDADGMKGFCYEIVMMGKK